MTDPRKASDCLPDIKAVLTSRGRAAVCFGCLARETNLAIDDVNRCMQFGLLIGFAFQTTACAVCNARAWCASYTPPPADSGFLT